MLLQIVLTLLLTIKSIEAIPPSGYKAKAQEPDEHPPKYEYGYDIADEKGRGQGKMETRDGIYALGRYYVQGAASSQSVEYLADDWGFHPYVEYSSTGPHSKSITQFALGKEAVKAFRNNNKEIFDPKIPLSESVKKLHEPDAPAQNQLPDAPRRHRPSVVSSEIRARIPYAKTNGPQAQTQGQPQAQAQQVVVIPTATLLETPQPSDIVLIPQPTQQSLPVNVMLVPQQTSDAYQQAQPLQSPPINFLVPVSGPAQTPQPLVLQQLQPQYTGGDQEGIRNDGNEYGNQKTDYQQQSEPKILLTPYAQEAAQNFYQQDTLESDRLIQQGNAGGQEAAQDFYQQDTVESDRLIQQGNAGGQDENEFAQNQPKFNDTQVQGQGQSDLEELRSHENQQALDNENLSYETIPQPEKLIAPQSQEEHQFYSEQQQDVQVLQENLGAQQDNGQVLLQQEPVAINLGVQMVKEVTKQQLLDNVQGREKFQSGGYQQLVHDDNLKLEHHQQLIQQSDVPQNNQIQPQNENLGPGLIINVQGEQVENSNRKTKVLETDSIVNQNEGNHTILNQQYGQAGQYGGEQEGGFLHLQQGIYNSPIIYQNEEGEQGNYFQTNSNQQHIQNLPLQIDEGNVLKNVLLTQKSAYYSQPQIVGEYTRGRVDVTTENTATLYQQGNVNQNVYDNAYNVDNLGGYGSKVNAKLILPEANYDRYVNTYRARPSKLIESTKNLVNGMDVLSINEAVDQNYDEVEGSTAKSVTNSIEQDLVSPGQHQLTGVHVETSNSNYEQHSSVSSTTTAPLTYTAELGHAPYALSLQNNPIIVGDYEENNLRASQNEEVKGKQEYFSTTHSTIETVDSNQNAQTTEATTVVVTPRPTGVQLEKAEEESKKSPQQNFLVEIQESVPFYVGKFEYVQNPAQLIQADASKQDGDKKLSSTYTHRKVINDLELGQSLLDFPLPESKHESSAADVDQLQEQGQVQQVKKLPPDGKEKLINHLDLPYEITSANYYQYHLPQNGEASLEIPHQIQTIADAKPRKKVIEKTVTKVVEKLVPQPYPVEKIVERPVHIPVEVTKYVDRPYPVHVPIPHRVPYPVEKIVEKYINRPYPVEVPIRVPVEVERRVPVPYPVEKIVEKPVIKIVEKAVPQPYPVEKVVEKPVQVPVEVTKYVDRPVAQPVPYPVPVEKIVNKPYPVEVRVPVQVPHPVPVEKVVEKKVPVHVQVPVPVAQAYVVPVEVPRPYPVHITKLVPQPYPVQVTQTVKVPVAVRVPHPVPVEVPKYIDRPFPIYVDKESQKHYQYYYYPNPYSYAPEYQPVTTNKQPIVAYGVPSYSVANLRQNQAQVQIQSTQAYAQYGVGAYQTPHLEYGAPDTPAQGIAKSVNQNEYIGLVPPPKESTRGVIGGYRKNRKARHNFEITPKLEYGFMPPLIPSLEIDENGNPIEKEDS